MSPAMHCFLHLFAFGNDRLCKARLLLAPFPVKVCWTTGLVTQQWRECLREAS